MMVIAETRGTDYIWYSYFETVMVNNSTNINKTNNHLSHQIMTLEIQVLALDRHINVAVLNHLMFSQSSHSWY